MKVFTYRAAERQKTAKFFGSMSRAIPSTRPGLRRLGRIGDTKDDDEDACDTPDSLNSTSEILKRIPLKNK
jgi:hypothetical protein